MRYIFRFFTKDEKTREEIERTLGVETIGNGADTRKAVLFYAPTTEEDFLEILERGGHSAITWHSISIDRIIQYRKLLQRMLERDDLEHYSPHICGHNMLKFLGFKKVQTKSIIQIIKNNV